MYDLEINMYMIKRSICIWLRDQYVYDKKINMYMTKRVHKTLYKLGTV